MTETSVRGQVPSLRVEAANFVKKQGYGLANSIGVPLDDRDCLGLTRESAQSFFGPYGVGITQIPPVKKRLFGLLKCQPPPEILLGHLLFCTDPEKTELSLAIYIYGKDNEISLRALALELGGEFNIPCGWHIESEGLKRVTHLRGLY